MKEKGRVIFLLAIITTVFGFVGCVQDNAPEIETMELVRVNDGDTVVIPNGKKPALFFYFTSAG